MALKDQELYLIDEEFAGMISGRYAARTLETTYDRGSISSRISSPEREKQIAAAVDQSAKDALKGMNIDASDVTIAVNDDGKLTATNLPPEDPRFQTIQSALELLNSQLETRSVDDAHGSDLSANPVKRLKGLLANWDVLQPGGLSDLKRPNAEAERQTGGQLKETV